MKRLYLMCGLPYAGKTTLATVVAARAGAVVVSLDDINAERGLDGADDLPVEEWARTHELALERVRALAAERRAIVVDDTNCFRWLRDDHRGIAAAHGYEVRVILVETEFSVLLERAQAEIDSGRKAVPLDMLYRMAAEFEAPTLDEHVLPWDGAEDPTVWAEQNIEAPVGA
jgi:predicted kinase